MIVGVRSSKACQKAWHMKRNIALYVLMYMCNKFKGWEDFCLKVTLLPTSSWSTIAIVLNTAERSVPGTFFQIVLEDSSSISLIFKPLIWNTLFASYPYLHFCCLHECVFKCLGFEMNSGSVAMAFKLNSSL